MKNKNKKLIFIFIAFVIMGGVYAGVISIFNGYLCDNGLLTPFAKFALIFILGFGLYKIYKWFCRRLDKISESK